MLWDGTVKALAEKYGSTSRKSKKMRSGQEAKDHNSTEAECYYEENKDKFKHIHKYDAHDIGMEIGQLNGKRNSRNNIITRFRIKYRVFGVSSSILEKLNSSKVNRV
jgi:hypothetical protein